MKFTKARKDELIQKIIGPVMTEKGTWEEKDGKYVFTANGGSMEVTLNGNVLSFEMEGVKLELKK